MIPSEVSAEICKYFRRKNLPIRGGVEVNEYEGEVEVTFAPGADRDAIHSAFQSFAATDATDTTYEAVDGGVRPNPDGSIDLVMQVA